MKRAAMATIGFYQRWISPLFPPSCRFHPTCSQYAYDAIAKYGVLKGGGAGRVADSALQPVQQGRLRLRPLIRPRPPPKQGNDTGTFGTDVGLLRR